MADTALFVFFYSQPFDTSSLTEIRPEKDIIRGTHYEILPNFHHFVTDYKDTASKYPSEQVHLFEAVCLA
jgi:hypothetical protein